MSLKLLRIPLGFFITGILWAVFNDSIIAALAGNSSPAAQHVFRFISYIVSVVIVSVTLYFLINQQSSRLAESEEQYKKLFELNPNPMWVYNATSLRFVKVNQAAVDLYGYNEDEFLAMTIMDIRPASDHEKLMDCIDNLNKGVNKSGKWQHLTKNGDLLYTSVVTYDLLFNSAACRLVMATNITDLVLKEEKIKAQNATLHQMAWSNSHEVRRALCSVMSLTALLKDAPHESERQEYIQMLQQCTQDFDELIRNNNKKVDSLKENG